MRKVDMGDVSRDIRWEESYHNIHNMGLPYFRGISSFIGIAVRDEIAKADISVFATRMNRRLLGIYKDGW